MSCQCWKEKDNAENNLVKYPPGLADEVDNCIQIKHERYDHLLYQKPRQSEHILVCLQKVPWKTQNGEDYSFQFQLRLKYLCQRPITKHLVKCILIGEWLHKQKRHALAWRIFVCQSWLTWKPRRSNNLLQTACPGRPPMLKIIIPAGWITEIPSSTALAINPKPNWSSTKPYIGNKTRHE